MVLSRRLRRLGAFAVVGGLPCLGMAYSNSAVSVSGTARAATPVQAAELQVNPFEGGVAGFVVSDIGWALGPDADKSGACPSGLTKTPVDLYKETPEGRRREGETEEAYTRRLGAYARPRGNAVNACQNPEAFAADPNYRTVTGQNIQTDGIDLDGVDSRGKGRTASGSCAHEDFRGANGERGIDNQFYRAVGCTTGFQSTGGKRGFVNEMLTGAWGILILVKGVDNPLNDDNVEIGIYANADPIQLSAARKPLTYATYAADRDPRFRASTRGRIVNGVLITDPVDVRFHTTTNSMWMERPINQARLHLKIMKDGSLDGIMAGYTDVDELFDFVVAYRKAKDPQGNPAPRRSNSSLGSSVSAGLTCNGLYYAMKQLADGNRDPKTGKCSSISNQYKIKAVRAFVVENPTPTRNLVAEAK